MLVVCELVRPLGRVTLERRQVAIESDRAVLHDRYGRVHRAVGVARVGSMELAVVADEGGDEQEDGAVCSDGPQDP